jgi:protocatechuate 3,4-dioxygenase beta subunit
LIALFQEDQTPMRARTLAALMAVLLLSWPAAAQDQRGTIEGTVKDASGAVLPGVTVEAKTTTGVVQSTTTDASGSFRFPSLPPGNYEVSANLASFSP